MSGFPHKTKLRFTFLFEASFRAVATCGSAVTLLSLNAPVGFEHYLNGRLSEVICN